MKYLFLYDRDQGMEMQLEEERMGISRNSYDLSPKSSSGIVGFARKRAVKIGIIVALGLLILIGLIIGVSYSGVNAKSISKTSDPEDEEPQVLPYVSNVSWTGKCPTKSETCPESYRGIPPLLLISLDGFRADYLTRGYTPTLENLAQCGTHAPHMYPVFPSKTFPNHYSIVTGLHPESHGIVDNTMYNPETGKLFKIGKPEASEPYWWEGEPIWVTAQKQGKRSHCFFWPGTDVKIKGVYPTVYKNYNKKIKFGKRIDTVLQWLDLPPDTRPNFMTLYVNQPDSAGHDFGPDSYKVNEALVEVDKMIAKLIHGLQKRDLLNCVNLIILADHGMTDIKCNRVIELQNYLNTSEVFSTYGPYGKLRSKEPNGTTVEEIISDLQCKNEHMRVSKKQQLPVRFHYSSNKLIEPVFLELDSGWTVGSTENGKYCSGGTHGYDNYFQDMRTLFMAHGPSFKFHHKVEPFLNIELYELMAEIMNITANPNNGTKGSLHHLLQNPSNMSEQSEPVFPAIGKVPSDPMDFKLRIYAANCSCTKNEETKQQDVENATSVYEHHLPFGIPIVHELNQSFLLLYNNDYIAAYDVKYRLPMWSSFTLVKKGKTEESKPCWKGDARIPFKDTPACSDYSNTFVSNLDIVQRPMFPPNFASAENMDEAFFVTNSVPKSKDHVSLIEEHFNWLLGSWVQLKGPLNVIAGPAFDVNGTGVFPGIALIMQTHAKYGPLVMPTHYFYVVTWCNSQVVAALQGCEPMDLSTAAFLLPNVPVQYNCEAPRDFIKKHVARVTAVEELTGMSFFTKLPIYDAIRLRTMVPEI